MSFGPYINIVCFCVCVRSTFERCCHNFQSAICHQVQQSIRIQRLAVMRVTISVLLFVAAVGCIPPTSADQYACYGNPVCLNRDNGWTYDEVIAFGELCGGSNVTKCCNDRCSGMSCRSVTKCKSRDPITNGQSTAQCVRAHPNDGPPFTSCCESKC